jgi:hypothetical protein
VITSAGARNSVHVIGHSIPSARRTNNMSEWKIIASKADLARISADSQFRAIVKLARAFNAVTSATCCWVGDRTTDTAAAQRIRLNAFLYVCPILYEGLELARALGKDLRTYPAFPEPPHASLPRCACKRAQGRLSEADAQ